MMKHATKHITKFNTKLMRIVLITLFLCSTSFVQAKNPKSVSLEDASKQVQSSSNGKIISAKTSHVNNQNIHKIKVLLPNGRIKTYRVPAENGSSHGSHDNSQQRRNNHYQQNNYRQNQSNSHYNNSRNNNSNRDLNHRQMPTRNTRNINSTHSTNTNRERERQR